jgi:hypothetical protein
MNARSYRVDLIISPLDFPPVDGVVENSVTYHSERFLKNNKVLLKITKKFILHNVDNKKEHEVISVQSVYEIPSNEIKSREDVYEFYNDALQSLDEVYKYAQTRLPLLPSRLFSKEPIENYKGEIDRVFNLLIGQN